MRRRSSSNTIRRSSTIRRRSEKVGFDEFGFALTKRKDQKLHHRCHDYSYPHLSSVRVKELCELLSYWNGASFICKSQIERFIRMGIPPSLRGRVWKCLLNIDSLKETSDFNYQMCLSEVRGPLVDLGVSEYGILSAIATLSETQNDLGLNPPRPPDSPEPCCSEQDITLFRQIALDLQRSFPTHRSLMGESPEAIEGQAKLFRVLIAYAKYNPQVGYSQGMSYIAAVLLMQLGEEEEAFWALAALLDKSKYLAELFDLSLTKLQHQVKVFDQFLKHRKPQLSKHMESVGVSSVHFAMPWFLVLFTSLPCWDSVLAVWDLIILHGLPAVFRTALTIVQLLELRLMDLNDEGAVLPLLLRVPVDVCSFTLPPARAQYNVLIPALWNTEVQDWELKCMNNLVLDDSHHGPEADFHSSSRFSSLCERSAVQSRCRAVSVISRATGSADPGLTLELIQFQPQVCCPANSQRTPPRSERSKTQPSKGRPLSLLTRVVRMAQRYFLDPSGRQNAQEKSSQPETAPRQRSPGCGFRSRTSASLPHAQVKSRGQQKGGVPPPGAQGAVPVRGAAGCGKPERCEQTLKRPGAGPSAKVAHRRSNHSIIHHVRARSLRLLRNGKGPLNHTPPSSVLPPSLRSSTLPPSSSTPSCPQSINAPQRDEQHNTALIK
ncbi:unnamed protein product [Menidia menidia]|uniref:(Atlantic silverside) hypothetical protein n=1 Tax=Menidia menidia TaxID=238744 RepID=A0A8S4BMX6_9TELE|nr:unnamed protein product [Menidia menidia]